MTQEGFVSSRSGTIILVVAVALTLTAGTWKISPEWLVANQRGVQRAVVVDQLTDPPITDEPIMTEDPS
jgi:hypothetical protein